MARFFTVATVYWLLVPLLFIGLAMQVPALYRLVAVDISTDFAAAVNTEGGKPGILRLGRRQLAAAQAAGEHVQLAFEQESKQWWLSNISHGKRVLHKPSGRQSYNSVRTMPLQSGDVLMAGDQQLLVESVTAGQLVLRRDTERLVLSARQGTSRGQALPPCAFSQGMKQAVRVWLHELLPNTIQLDGRWRLGGEGEDCFGKLGFSALLPGQWQFAVEAQGASLLRTATVIESQWPLLVMRGEQTFNPDTMQVPLQHGDQLIIGHTHFRVQQYSGRLRLLAGVRTQRRTEPSSEDPGALWQTWMKEPIAGESLPTLKELRFAPLLLVPFLLPLLWRQRRYVRAFGGLARVRLGVAAASMGLAAMVFVNLLVLPQFILVMVGLLMPGLCMTRRWKAASARLLWFTSLLYAVGLICLWQLGAYSPEGHWASYAHKMACFGIVSFSVLLIATELLCSGCVFSQNHRVGVGRWRWMVRLVALLAGLGIFVQFTFGVEAGVAGIQPVELVKLSLVLWLAAVMASRLMLRGRERGVAVYRVWLTVLWRYALLALLCTGALLWLRDFSPVVLLSSLLFGVFLAYYFAHPQPRVARRGLLALLAVALLTSVLAFLAHQNPEYLKAAPQSDRFLVWGEPALYPISGEQLSRAQAVAREGGLMGNATALNPSHVTAVPAIQDDFMPSFFRYRHGGLGVLVLLLLQAGFISAWLSLGQRAVALVEERGSDDYRTREFGFFVAFCCVGGAAVSLAHFLVSWGTNTGSLPVMGQPMPFLSAGGSHLLLFLLPLITITVIATEEMENA